MSRQLECCCRVVGVVRLRIEAADLTGYAFIALGRAVLSQTGSGDGTKDANG
jgi:hypothetical protein